MSKCCWPLRGVAPPRSAAISMSALAAGIAPSPTTLAATGTARSVRPRPANGGSQHVAKNFSRRATSMWSSRCLVSWHHWPCRTRRSSTICCFAPVRKHFSKSLAIPDISVPRSASSACCIPGTKSSSFTRMSIASFPPAGCRSITRTGLNHATVLSSHPGAPSRFSRQVRCRLSSRPSVTASCDFHGDLTLLAQPKTFAAWLRPLFRNDWVVYSKPPFGGPEYVLQYLGRYTHRVAISNHRLVSFAEGKVTFRWRDSAHHNEQKLMTLSLDEFLRRFLLHVLPKGFVRIRNFGFLANRRRATTLPLCFQLLGAAATATANKKHPLPMTRALFGSVPSVVGRWWSSRDSLLPKSNSVLHRSRSRLPHETTLIQHHENFACFGALRLLCVLPPNKSLLPASPTLSSAAHSFVIRQLSVPRVVCCASAAPPRRTSHATPPLHSICIGPASAATTGGFLQVVVSKAREHAVLVRAPCLIALPIQH